MIYVIDFPFCNFFSLERYFRIRNKSYKKLGHDDSLQQNDVLILPGVGTFGQAMHYMNSLFLSDLVRRHARNGGHVLGICLGMQLLFESSAESPGVEGLSLVQGHCIPIPKAENFRIPHIGWNQLLITTKADSALSDLAGSDSISLADFYFVHSFVAQPDEQSIVTAHFEHPCRPLCAAIAYRTVNGVQFHPEKSGADGYALLDRILDPPRRG